MDCSGCPIRQQDLCSCHNDNHDITARRGAQPIQCVCQMKPASASPETREVLYGIRVSQTTRPFLPLNVPFCFFETFSHEVPKT
ncbi:hypothetical protein CHARACLAT_028085 [Characodon lateralis]|uniref:Uncharacterized protein n=1 Tax=Characodon lateralis TaxID=208331 RepID=A0ABU7D5F4_9TELE|nr:hypothetical protein [Characodon lateralis]